MEIARDISEELKVSYLDYAMSVIVGRAIPDVRDGLKPVQRRILYAMYEMGLYSNRPYRKSARIVGDVLGKYHPHGDSAVYDALVRMAQDFNMRYPLIDGQGNFGSIDGDEPAAMRYTEARLTKLAEEMLADIDKETVDFIPNFDATLKEPVVLPARLPNLLINGSSGIAVGMATNMPPHNLREICGAIIAYIENEDITVEELMEYVKGPDFPTGGIIVGTGGIRDAYQTGRGKITVRGRAEIEDNSIVIREIPYQVNKANLVEKIAGLARDGKIEEIKTVRDESDREGIRIVVELKNGANAGVVLNRLYKYTQLQTTFGIINLALVDNQPRVMSLKELIAEFVRHRREVVRRRAEYELRKAEERLHIVEGLKIAIENIDEAIEIIKKSESTEVAKRGLVERFELTEKQAEAILQMRLQRLTAMEIDSLLKEYRELKEKIEELKSILASRRKIDEIIIRETREIAEKYGDERRTRILADVGEITEADLIAEEENLLIVTKSGYVKRVDLKSFRAQGRGGVGVQGINLRNEDEIAFLGIVNSAHRLILFTNKGRAYWINAYEIPKLDRVARGTSLRNMVSMESDEHVISALSVEEFKGEILLLTADGYIKTVKLSEFENAKRSGIIAVTGEPVAVKPARGKEVIITTRNGMLVRFDRSEVPTYGRTAKGVKAIRLKSGDEIAWMDCGSEREILLLSENGYGKRVKTGEFRKISRGGQGVICFKATSKTGKVVFAEFVRGNGLFAFSRDGNAILVNMDEISVQGRNTTGVIVARNGVVKATQVNL
ncbi:DNA gyrase subunit A [Geoglobus acetivorans]|uniref:DNA gyrase subunit A n=1 Tax=Geoglobus acetivorans TaxID=565033 RepID=A0ABZ3H5Q4_GEOAI|nr:DNA gyrase subunit A [Geoglobus acetivorans]